VTRKKTARYKTVSETDWLEVPLGDLVTHIQQVHHASLLAELPRLSYLANRVASRHGELYPELWDVQSLLAIFVRNWKRTSPTKSASFCRYAGNWPMRTVECSDGSIANTICVLEMEHTFLNETVSAMLDAVQSSVPPEEACNSYRVLVDGLKMLAENFRQCVCEENEMLFPRALFVSQCTVTATS
jgi:regulator of cell morphogenesis and NO signaling